MRSQIELILRYSKNSRGAQNISRYFFTELKYFEQNQGYVPINSGLEKLRKHFFLITKQTNYHFSVPHKNNYNSYKKNPNMFFLNIVKNTIQLFFDEKNIFLLLFARNIQILLILSLFRGNSDPRNHHFS